MPTTRLHSTANAIRSQSTHLLNMIATIHNANSDGGRQTTAATATRRAGSRNECDQGRLTRRHRRRRRRRRLQQHSDTHAANDASTSAANPEVRGAPSADDGRIEQVGQRTAARPAHGFTGVTRPGCLPPVRPKPPHKGICSACCEVRRRRASTVVAATAACRNCWLPAVAVQLRPGRQHVLHTPQLRERVL